MPSSILCIKPEDIDSIEKRQKHTICIIGCGRIGVLHACLSADAGFKVVGWDADQVVTKYLARGRTPFLRRDVQLLLRKHIKHGNIHRHRKELIIYLK